MINKSIIIIIAIFIIFPCAVFANESTDVAINTDIAAEMDYFGLTSLWRFEMLYDDDYTTFYSMNMDKEQNYFGFINQSGQTIKYVYLMFSTTPEEYKIEKSIDGIIYKDIVEVSDRHLSKLIEVNIEPNEYFRFQILKGNQIYGITTLEVYADNEMGLPEHVQNFKQTIQDTDLMIFSAHSDDEWVFFGGAIPKYSIDEKRKTIVVYMAADRYHRRLEALSALWSAREDTYPIFADFDDHLTMDIDDTRRRWGETQSIEYCVRLIRKYKPEVILTHDFDGEYGHGNHKMTAYAVDKAIISANDESYDIESIDKYGLWNVSKLYIHLYEENQITIDYTQPLDAYNGLNAIDVSKKAIKENISQIKYTSLVYVHTEEEYSISLWGLRHSTVGEDTYKRDFFENIVYATPTPTVRVTNTPKPTPTPTQAITFAPTSIPVLTTVSPQVEKFNSTGLNDILSVIDKYRIITLICMVVILIVILLMISDHKKR